MGEIKKGNYQFVRKIISQPVDHSNPDGEKFDQRVDILIPDGAPSNAPVFFHLGNEQELNEEKLVILYNAYGKRNDLIFVQAEHRGYGKSLSRDSDQSVPSYVRIDQALADYHEVVRVFKEDFNGPWIGVGYSYGGGLVINFAVKYSKDIKAVLCSSGVIDWPFVIDAYDCQMRINFGEKLYNGLVKHINNLEPKELFDQNWLEREFLIAVCHGLAQMEELTRVQSTIEEKVNLPTQKLLEGLHKIDNEMVAGEGWRYAISNAKFTLSREEALSGKYTWRVWRYQQCTETGVFEISTKPNGIFTRTFDDFREECIALFHEEPRAAKGLEWKPRVMLKSLKIPLIYVCGGIDPWKGLGLEPDYKIDKGKYFHYPEGRHCPEKAKPRRGKQVIEELLRHVKMK